MRPTSTGPEDSLRPRDDFTEEIKTEAASANFDCSLRSWHNSNLQQLALSQEVARGRESTLFRCPLVLMFTDKLDFFQPKANIQKLPLLI